MVSTWGELPRVAAVLPNGALLEFFGKSDHTTWTMVVRKDGQSCTIMFGRGWMPIRQEELGPKT